MLASLYGGLNVAMILGFMLVLDPFFFELLKIGGGIMRKNTLLQNLAIGILSSLVATEIHQVWLIRFALS